MTRRSRSGIGVLNCVSRRFACADQAALARQSFTRLVATFSACCSKPSPRDLGSRDEIAAVDTTLHVDPMLADDGTALRQRLADLEPTLREELQRIWADRPSWAASVGAPEDLYTIDLEDGTFLVIAQLEDTTYVVAGVDPPRSGVHRYEAEGDLIGEYATVREAVVAEP